MWDTLGSAIGAAAKSFVGGKSGGGTVIQEAPRVEFDKMNVSNTKSDLTRETQPAEVVGPQDPMSYWTGIFKEAMANHQQPTLPKVGK